MAAANLLIDVLWGIRLDKPEQLITTPWKRLKKKKRQKVLAKERRIEIVNY